MTACRLLLTCNFRATARSRRVACEAASPEPDSVRESRACGHRLISQAYVTLTGLDALSARQKAAGWLLLSLWASLRLALIPSDAAITPGFSHDSAYLSIVARNLQAGLGYVNDAHWLLFLNPPRLPMPYHNANPLYPSLSAGVAWLAHTDTARGGAIVSALSNVLLAFSAFWLVRRLWKSFWLGVAAAAAVALWPSNFRDSFAILPDALAAACAITAVAIALHGGGWWRYAVAGVWLGAAWLARSSALLVLPGLALWIYFQDRKRLALNLGCLLAGAGLAASPWLVRTARVRGSPFASDNEFYWLQEYHAHKAHSAVDQYWRSLTPPPGLGEIVRTEPLEFVTFLARGVPAYIYMLLAEAADWSKLAAAALLTAAALALSELNRRAIRSPAFAAAAVTVILSLVSLLPRPNTVEIRYLAAANTLLAIGMVFPFSPAASGRLAVWGRSLLIVCVLVFAVPQDLRVLRMAWPDPQAADYKATVLAASSRVNPGGPVITDSPYFYTYFTGLPAISPPYPSKRELLEIMRRYGARYVLLPRARLDYYYPGAPESLRPELAVDAELGADVLLKLI